MPRRKAAIVTAELRAIVEQLGEDPASLRDRAVLLIGFVAALRRSEISALNVEDVTIVRAGLEVSIRRSKTDQLGAGCMLPVPYGSSIATCPVRALQAWLELAGSSSGPLFVAINRGRRITPHRLSGESIATIVQRRSRAAGIETDIGGHSLRAGFCTSAADANVSLLDSMTQNRHRSMQVAAIYVRRSDAWKLNVASKVGL